MVKNKTLILLAGLIWLIAGFNILKIGILAYMGHFTIVNILISLVIFYLFWFKIFKHLVNKHTTRILEYQEEKQYFWHFFDMKSYIIMFFMMGLGISIRTFNLLPDQSIGVFYLGLGSALFLAGIIFIYNYINNKKVI